MGAASSVLESQDNSASSDPKTKLKNATNKITLYRAIKEQFAELEKQRTLNPELFSGIEDIEAAEAAHVAKNLEVTEELIKAIYQVSTPKKPKPVQPRVTSPTSPRRYAPGSGSASPTPFFADEFSPIKEVSGNARRKTSFHSDGTGTSPMLPGLSLQVSGFDALAVDGMTLPTPAPSADPDKCKAVANRMITSRVQNFLVGVDGSNASMVAFKLGLLMRKPKGKYLVAHIEDMTKDYLPLNQRWEGIRNTCDSFLAPTIPLTHYNLENIPKHPLDTTKTSFVTYANNLDMPVYVCVGWVGRKGPKEDPTVLGSVTDVALRACHHPVIICKKIPEGDAGTSHSYVVCCEGDTERGNFAFDTTLALIKPIDTVTVVHCYSHGDAGKMQEVKKHFEKRFFEEGVDTNKFSVKFLEKQVTELLHQPIAEYINEVEPTFTIVAPDPAKLDQARMQILSVSEHLLKDCKCNFIILKVPKDVEVVEEEAGNAAPPAEGENGGTAN